MSRLLVALCVLIVLFSPAVAEERSWQGFGLLVTNDSLGDTHDRWRTGSFASSLVWGSEWSGRLPRRFGALLELRINGQVVGPENPAMPAPLDRRYGQALSFGVHTHFQPGAIAWSVGADLVATGPQTGLDHMQEALHDVLGGRDASPAVKAAQIGNDLHPTLVVEAGREFALGTAMRLRPFVEARAGIETLLRAGADLTVGRFGEGGLLVRAPVTGQRFSAVAGTPYSGFSAMFGADIARVADSEFYPAGPVRPRKTRAGARAGLHWRSHAGTSIFYGLTWLGREFATQREAQVVGSVQLRVKF